MSVMFSGQKAFSPTYLLYEEGDVLGQLACIASLLPYMSAIFLGAYFVALRGREVLDAGVCILCSDVVNIVLKNIIREPRPSLGGAVREDFGMPSRHAQWMACICVLAILYKPKARQTPLFPLLMWVLVLSVATARVYLGYHTVQQVGVGCVVGCLFAVYWHNVMRKVLTKLGISPFLHTTANAVLNCVVTK